MPTALKSKPSNIFLMKVWMPLLCVLISSELFGGKFVVPDILLALPWLIAAAFGVSVAAVEARDGGLRYRRLFKWRTIPHDQVVEARRAWPPFLGSIRMKTFVFPWGRLYFALDPNTSSNPFRAGQYPLLTYISNITQPDRELSSTLAHPAPDGTSVRKLLIAAASGALLYPIEVVLSGFVTFPRSTQLPHPMQPPFLHVLFGLPDFLAQFPVQVAFLVIFAFLAIYQRRRPDAWIYAFFTGLLVSYTFHRLLKLI